MHRLSEYIDSVKSGDIVTGQYIKLAIDRHERDLTNDKFEFRPEEAQKAIDFIALLKHSTDASAGKPFILESWQVFLVASLFGWYLTGTNKRRYTSSYIQIARKNGKSALTVALALYSFVIDSQQNSEVLMAANSVKQAKDVLFKLSTDFCRSLDPREQYIKAYYNELRFKGTGSFFKILASDVKNLAGYNCSFGIIDEYYSASNGQIRELFRTSQIMRENKHLMTITTAGFDLNGPCYELRNSCVNILDQTGEDDSTFTLIYELDPEDDWTDEKNWIKANPNLDVTVRRDTLEDSVNKAKLNPSIETDIRTLNMNQWMATKSVWIPERYVSKCFEPLKMEDFKDEECIVGVDLASVSDLTAVVTMFMRDDEYYFFPHFFIPQDTLTNRSDEHTYKNWIHRDEIIVTPGNVTDYDYVTKVLMEIDKYHYIKEIAYDKWNATQFAIQATSEGLPLREFSQAIGNFNGPTREMERLIMSGKVHIQTNEIMANHFRNVELKHDHNGNCKPTKTSESRKKLDGVIAMIQALGVHYYTKGTGSYNIY